MVFCRRRPLVESVPLIEFTIAGVTYSAEEGMTFAQWCDSEYNTGGFYVNAHGEINKSGTASGSVASDYEESGYYVHGDTVIVAGRAYVMAG